MLETIIQLYKFALTHNKIWFIPLVMLVLLVSLVIILSQSAAVAPMIYAIF